MNGTARECSYCEIRWPNSEDFELCPQCLEQTLVKYGKPALHSAEAVSLKREYEFGWWLWDTGRL